MKQTLFLLAVFLFSISLKGIGQSVKRNKPAGQERVINTDFNKTAGPFNTMFKECVGAGRANEGLRADWQQQLAYVKNECGFRYIRMHGLLCDDMGVYKEGKHGEPEYNYMYVDVLFDFLHSIGTPGK